MGVEITSAENGGLITIADQWGSVLHPALVPVDRNWDATPAELAVGNVKYSIGL
jgi:hypothetical protein